MRLMDKIMQVVQVRGRTTADNVVKRVTLNAGKTRGYVDNGGEMVKVEYIGNQCWVEIES